MAQAILLTSAPRTVTTDSGIINPNGPGFIVVDVTAITATPALTPTLLVAPDAGADGVIWTAAATITDGTAVGVYTYYFSDVELTTAFNVVIESSNVPLPEGLKFRMAHADADSVTYSVVWAPTGKA